MIFLYAWETIAHYNSVGNPSADSFVPINPLAGGHLDVLWQPLEFLIIGGAATGALFIANPPKVLAGVAAGYGAMIKGPKYKKPDYLELLTMQYQIFRMARTKGMLALEQHVENPHESIPFQAFPNF